MTVGAIRAVFLKHSSCPVLPDDIEGDQCSGACHMSWYASYDRYTGALAYTDSARTTVPSGDGDYPDKRAAGNWYIGIESSALTTTEFFMEVEVLEDQLTDSGPDCSERYACDNEVWVVPPDLVATDEDESSAGVRRGQPSGASVSWRAAGVACACAWALAARLIR